MVLFPLLRFVETSTNTNTCAPQVPLNGDRDVVTITFGTGEISGVFMKDVRL